MPSKGRRRKGKGTAAGSVETKVDTKDPQEVTSTGTKESAAQGSSTQLPLAGSPKASEAPSSKTVQGSSRPLPLAECSKPSEVQSSKTVQGSSTQQPLAGSPKPSEAPSSKTVQGSLMQLPLAGSSQPSDAPSSGAQGRSKRGRRKPRAVPPESANSNAAERSEQPAKRKPVKFNSRKGRFEFQHFIPRLVLREFATPESRAAAAAAGDPRNPSIHVYSMENGSITPHPVGRCYGHMNMYKDAGASLEDEMHIEQALGVLEGQAAQIITRIKKAQAQNEPSVTLTRQERNCIRKFLFVMKFRTPLFWRKYKCTAEEYQHIDREEVLQFMQVRGFEKPIEVWLHSLKTIIATPVDSDEEWERIIMKKCFVHDALWYLLHMNGSFMSFCQPADPEDEFILSESAFGIHEGPTEAWSSFFPEGTKEAEKKRAIQGPDIPDLSTEEKRLKGGGWYTEYHHLAPCSPRLLLVLRSNELRDEESKRRLREKADLGLPGSHQWKIPSAFDHLQLEIPQPSYLGKVAPENFRLSDDHTFTFKLQKISHNDLVLFNSIILNEVRNTLTWQSDLAMRRTLGAYLEEERFRLPKSALIFFRGEDPEITRREQLHTLLGLLYQRLGESLTKPPPSIGSHVKGMLEFEQNFLKNPTRSARGFLKLGGLATHWTRDMMQSTLASALRNQVADALPPGPHRRSYRNAAFRNVLGVLATLPPTVIFLHVNVWRMGQENRQSGGTKTREEIMTECMGDIGAEDAVANVASKLPREQLSRLMLHASFRRVCQRQGLITGNDSSEMSCYSNFGGLVSSFLIEGTPWYEPRVGAAVLNPNRDTEIPFEQMRAEFGVRWLVKQSGFIKHKWGAEVDSFVWEWLYTVPELNH